MNKDEDYKDDFWEWKDILGEKKKQDDRGSAKNNQLIPYIIILNLP